MNLTSPSIGQASVRVLRELSELEEIRSVWESWPGNRDSEIDTYLAFLQSNLASVRPHILAVYRDGKPDAILVGRIDRGKIGSRLGYLNVGFRAQIMCFVYGAFRGTASSENCQLMIDEVLRSLWAGEADAAYMNFLEQDSHLRQLAMTKPPLVSRDCVHVTQPHFALSLPSTVDEFYQGLSPKARKNQRWQAKRLEKNFSGNVRVHCYRESKDVDKMAADVEQVAKRSYQRGIGVGFHDDPQTRERLKFKADRGWLRGYVLYLADRPCAFWLGDINGTTFGSDYIGYDAEFASHSPGMYLVMKVIERFCDGNRDGVTAVDFGPGDAQYKAVLSNRRWAETSVYIFAPSVKGLGLNLVRSIVGRTDQTIKRALARTNLLQKAKKLWRGRATSQRAAQN